MAAITVECPKCLQKFTVNTGGKRICATCGKVIKSGHKWTFRTDSKVQHRNCQNPQSYDLPHVEIPDDARGKPTSARGSGRPGRDVRKRNKDR